MKYLLALSLAHVHAQLCSIAEWRRCFDAGRKLVDDTGFVDIDIARSTLRKAALVWVGCTKMAKEFKRTWPAQWSFMSRLARAGMPMVAPV